MSGHSKWSQIKRQKGLADIKRGQSFTKVANVITIAVRQGGGISDPNQNFRLRLAIDKARSLNMPKENIERAIQRALGKQGASQMEEVTYEGFGPGKVAIMVSAVTDNKQRTTAQIKNVFDKNGAIFATPGAVSYQFEQKGIITVSKNGKSLDEILTIAVDLGVEDLEEAGEEVFLYTKPEDLAKAREKISEKLTVVNAELIRKPKVIVPVSDRETAVKLLSFIEKLEELDDVQKAYANFDIPDELLQK